MRRRCCTSCCTCASVFVESQFNYRPRAYRHVRVQALSALMGAEVSGVDLSAPLTPSQCEAIEQAFLTYQLLVFREQRLDKPQQIAFTEQFGTLERHASINRGTNDFPLLHVVTNRDNEAAPRQSSRLCGIPISPSEQPHQKQLYCTRLPCHRTEGTPVLRICARLMPA